MADCSTTCQRVAPGRHNLAVIAAAERLACLLAETDTLQSFLQQSRAVHLDWQARALVDRINDYESAVGPDTPDPDDLEAQLEALPVVRSYRSAEEAARALFRAADATISAAVGVPFAENARPSACG